MAKSLLISALLALCLAHACEATVYTVGDGAGWDISADLPSWAANKIFYVGDVLLFQYSNYHTLNEVDRDGYSSCNATNALLTKSDGNTSVPLNTAGDKYFICGAQSHCFGGMKLQVSVNGGNATAPTASPQSPEFHPESPPPLLPKPSTKNNNPLPPLSNGFVHGTRGPTFEVWFSTIGALLWATLTGM